MIGTEQLFGTRHTTEVGDSCLVNRVVQIEVGQRTDVSSNGTIGFDLFKIIGREHHNHVLVGGHEHIAVSQPTGSRLVTSVDDKLVLRLSAVAGNIDVVIGNGTIPAIAFLVKRELGNFSILPVVERATNISRIYSSCPVTFIHTI